VYEVPSDSGGKDHVVKLWLRDNGGFKRGSMSCDCMAWRFKKQPIGKRDCKHTDHVGASLSKEVFRILR